MRAIFSVFVVTMACLLAAPIAFAASWPSLPVACTPERAAPWEEGKSEEQQAACHCPPTSMCPTTYEQYSDGSKSPIPMKFVLRCCPVIEGEKCAVGTQLSGQPKPANGDCNPYCPTGTILAGELIPADKNCSPVCPSDSKLAGQAIPADKNCNPVTPVEPTCPLGSTLAGQAVPKDGNCNPATDCPAKYYPTLGAAISNPNFTETNADWSTKDTPKYMYRGTYAYGNGSTHDFDHTIGYYERKAGASAYLNARMTTRYLWSLRLSGMKIWIHGGNCYNPKYGYNWQCAVPHYSAMTDGVNNGDRNLSSIISAIGMEKLSWFGASVVKTDRIENNLADDAILKSFAVQEVISLGEANANPAFTNGAAAGFMKQCSNVAGEYVELERINHKGASCAYLQCRYIYESGAESCLSGQTAIVLADGTTKPVKDLKLGDVVKGSDGDHKITATNVYQSALRVLYGINGGGAMLTGDPPIRTTNGWKVITEDAAKLYADKPGFAKTKLEVGDVLVTEKGEVTVESITRFPKIEPISTYNIKVDGNAGFFANGIEVKGFNKMEMQYE